MNADGRVAALSDGPIQRATLQMLPGRLQPLDPEIVKQEVRFMRTSERDLTVTLGWDEADPAHHVTLDHPSILPRHARMSFLDGQWWIESLSDRDPVIVDDERLSISAGPLRLENEARIQIGEARFLFRWP